MMDLLSLVSENLCIPRHQCNFLSPDRVVCIVSQDWWKQCCQGKVKLLQALDVIQQTQAEQLLAGTCLTVPEQWKKISVKIVPKITEKVQSLRDGPLYPTECARSLIEYLATTSQENFRNQWHAAYRKFKKDHVPTELHCGEEHFVVFKKYMWRMLPDVYINLDDAASSAVLNDNKKVNKCGWYNVVPTKAFVESSSHYFLIQPSLSYSLSDIVSFSPAILNSSNAHTLFILYQILQAMKTFHENGLSIGNITMHNVMLDKNLWAYVSVPHLHSVMLSEQKINSDQKTLIADSKLIKPAKQICKSETSKKNVLLTSSPSGNHSNSQGSNHDAKKDFTKKNNIFLSRVLRHDSGGPELLTEGEQCLRNAQEFLNKCHYQQFEVHDLADVVKNWVNRQISNFKYLMILNHLAGRKMGDPNNHPVLPWIMDFTSPDGNFRDLTMSKFRLNKGDGQLDLTFSTMSLLGDDGTDIPHHVSDVLSDITYYVYKARRTPKSVLCSHVRTNWVPHEYPSSIVRLQEWTPDECIPEFFTDPNIFVSVHDDLPDLEIPGWCSSTQEFIIKHISLLESEKISESLHHWIDLTFGYKLTGNAAVKSKNVYLQLVDQHKTMTRHGVVQLFSQPHPHRLPLTSFCHPHPPKVTREILSSQLTGIGISMEDAEAKSTELSFEPLDQTRPDNATIHLPKSFQPTAELEHCEAQNNFLTRSMLANVEPAKKADAIVPEHTCIVTEDVLRFACLMCEMFLAPKLMMQDSTPSLASRYQNIKRLSSADFMELPRPLQKAASFLIHTVEINCDGANGTPIFSYPSITTLGLPPPTPTQLLQLYSGIFPFPGYFIDLHACICELKSKDFEVEYIQNSNKSVTEMTNLIKQTERQKVPLIERFLTRYQGKLDSEGLHLVLPYIEDLYNNENTTVQAAWSLFGIVSRELGFKETTSKFMPYLIKLFAGEHLTAKHAKLYSRTFLMQLIIRLGLETFLLNFSTLLVEAVSGYKDFSLPSKYYQEELLEEIQGEAELSEQTEFWSKDTTEFPENSEIWSKTNQDNLSSDHVVSDEPETDNIGAEALTENNSYSWDTAQEDNTENTAADVDEIEEEFPDSILLNDDGLTQDHLLPGDVRSLGQSSNVSDESCERHSLQGDSDTEPMVTASDRVSIHSISNIIGSSRIRSVSAGESETGSAGEPSTAECSGFDDSSPNPDTSTLSGKLDPKSLKHDTNESSNISPSNSSPVSSKCPDLSDKAVTSVDMTSHMVRSETDDLIMLNLSTSSPADILNIRDIASESVKWLCCKLGPVLTAKYFSKNLIRMLALCYFGNEQLEVLQISENDCLKSSKLVVGDQNAEKILECLGHVALLYGEQVILLQYLQCIVDMVSVSQRRLTQRSESGLFGALILLKYIIPFISDKALLDYIEDTIIQNCLMAVIKLVTNTSVSFPGGSYVRSIVCYKVVDAVYVIGLRLGFEMTRIHLSQCMQNLFEVFSHVYGHLTNGDQSSDIGAGTSPGGEGITNSEESYLTIKMDPTSQEYKIGTPVYISGLSPDPNSSVRKSQSTSKFHSLTSLGAIDDREDNQELKAGPKENGMQEVASVFTAELAQAIYIPLCRIFGSIHMEQNLKNDDLIRQLCAQQDQSVDRKKETKETSDNTNGSGIKSEDSCTDNEDEPVTGAIGKNVEIVGNRIQLTKDSPDVIETHQFGRGYKHSGILAINPDDVKCCEMEYMKQRHLKGNWLAYWEHELGLHERDTLFNFKQIKLQTFVGHTGSIRSLCVMDNESSFISASKDKTVKLWSVTSQGDGSSRVSFQWNYTKHKKSVFSVAFVDSRRLVASCDSTVHIWDPFTGELVDQLESAKYAPVVALTALPAPSTLVVTATTEATLRFLDTRIAKYAHEFRCTVTPAGFIRCVTVSPDGSWIAVGFATGVISILEANSGLLISTWKAHEGEILQIKAFSKNKLVSSSFDQTMKLWKVEDASLILVLKGPSEPVHCICFYRNQILSATTGNKIGLHTSIDDTASFSSTKLRTDTFKGVLTSMALLPMNRSLLLGADNGSIRLLC